MYELSTTKAIVKNHYKTIQKGFVCHQLDTNPSTIFDAKCKVVTNNQICSGSALKIPSRRIKTIEITSAEKN